MDVHVGDAVIWQCPSDGKSAERSYRGRVESIDGKFAHITAHDRGGLAPQHITVLIDQLKPPSRRKGRHSHKAPRSDPDLRPVSEPRTPVLAPSPELDDIHARERLALLAEEFENHTP